MNQRQKKKKYKKLYGHNPLNTKKIKLSRTQAEQIGRKLRKSYKKAMNRVFFMAKDLAKRIQEMPEEEFQRVIKELTPKQREQVKKIRYKK